VLQSNIGWNLTLRDCNKTSGVFYQINNDIMIRTCRSSRVFKE